MINLKNNKGITLYALIITVVVLILIAGTATYTGMDVYQDAKEEAFVQELQIVQNAVNNIRSKLEECDQSYIDYIFREDNVIIPNVKDTDKINDNHPLKNTENTKLYGYRYLNKNALKSIGIDGVNQDVIINFTTGEVFSAKGYNNKYTLNDFNMNIISTSSEIIISQINNISIPNGFAYLQGSKDEGLVIINQEDGNEFVWVPVEDINDFARLKENSQTNYEGILYTFANGTSTEYIGTEKLQHSEPKVIAEYDRENLTKDENTNLTDEEKDAILETEFQSEFNNMVESVKKYKGFYVGRYETSLAEEKAASVANVIPMRKKTWYEFYNKQKELYSENNSDVGAISGMIYGSQWDAIMNWMLKGTDREKQFVYSPINEEGISMGWKSDNYYTYNRENKTGIDSEAVDNKVKNIYDLSGNLWEWTQEVGDFSTTNLTEEKKQSYISDWGGLIARELRGANYGNNPNYATYARWRKIPTFDTKDNLTSRLQLYIKVD